MSLVQELLLKTTDASSKMVFKISGVLGVRCYEGTFHVVSEEAALSFFFNWLQIAAKTMFALPLRFLEAIRNT